MFPSSRRAISALVLSATVLIAACGDEKADVSTATTAKSDTSATSAAAAPTTAAAGVLPKPEVKIPSELPTKLVITDLKEGEGRAAVVGDAVTVHYVGVRSADGTEFDNSYDRGSPFPVMLGTGGVIQGWDQGLLGVKPGGRRQLDIPADLAYGDSPQGDVIKPGDALTFVVDVVSVEEGPEPLPETDKSKEPTITVKGAGNVAAIKNEDLVVGTGDEVKAGDNLAVHIKAFRADTGEMINSSWENPTAIEVVADPAQVIKGLADGLIGMKVGGRRQVTIPFADAFGAEGNENLGLPASTDLVMVIDVFAVR